MSFISEKTVKATRKLHQCVGCLKHITTGEPAANWVGLTDGDFASVYYHPECRKAEVALNELHGSFHDEWQALNEAEREDYPWLNDNHPLAYGRLLGAKQ